MKKKENILVCLSGGVDSAVSAALLLDQGHRVTGAYMKQWSDSGSISGVCQWKEDRRDALRVAAKLGIDCLTLDFEKEYRKWVMSYLFDEYAAGRTPNPDVMCNKTIKFGVWLEKAKDLGFDAIATGHYASLGERDGEYRLQQAADSQKDQTYFLHQLSQNQLKHSRFPLGMYTKKEVRAQAHRCGLPNADRPESMGICFVGEIPMKKFLEQKISRKPGNVVTTAGDVLGTHDGLAFYTIGQRQLGLQPRSTDQTSETKPLYVAEKRFGTNELVVGFEDDPLLYKEVIQVHNMHWVSGHTPPFELKCEVRLRHRQPLQRASVTSAGSDLAVSFHSPQRAVTPGQFAVFYKGGECLGGGVIVIS
jgi:tRNA-uridine 2-sulfurtransferase